VLHVGGHGHQQLRCLCSSGVRSPRPYVQLSVQGPKVVADVAGKDKNVEVFRNRAAVLWLMFLFSGIVGLRERAAVLCFCVQGSCAVFLFVGIVCSAVFFV